MFFDTIKRLNRLPSFVTAKYRGVPMTFYLVMVPTPYGLFIGYQSNRQADIYFCKASGLKNMRRLRRAVRDIEKHVKANYKTSQIVKP